MTDAAQILTQAYDQIEAGNLESARQLLSSIKATSQDNPDFWWVYAHAVDNEEEGREALKRVETLAPSYPGLGSLAERAGLTQRPTRIQPLKSTVPPPNPPNMPSTSTTKPKTDGAETPTPNRSRMAIFAVAVVVLVFLVLGLVLPNLMRTPNPATDGSPTPRPTDNIVAVLTEMTTESATESATDVATEASVATAVSTETEAVELTEAPSETAVSVEPTEASTEVATTESTEVASSTEIPTGGSLSIGDVATSLATFNVPADGVRLENTELGYSLLVTVCAPPGPVATESFIGVANQVGGNFSAIDDTLQALVFVLSDCASNTPVRSVGIARPDVEAFVAGTLTRSEFQQLLRPLS